jgi:hypothetical protein
MKRLAILFAVIAMMSTGRLFMGRHWNIIATRLIVAVTRVKTFVVRQMRLLPGT